MASRLDIANRALQRVGAKRITSLTEGSKSADAVNSCFDFLLEAELQENFWTFSIERAALAADSETPISGRTYQYQLPDNYLRMAPLDPFYVDGPSDFLFEGRKLLTDQGAPLYIRYVASDKPEETFHPMFSAALAMRIALEICEELTQSSSKQDRLEAAYDYFIKRARSMNAIEAGPIAPEIDELVAVRISDAADPTLRRYSN